MSTAQKSLHETEDATIKEVIKTEPDSLTILVTTRIDPNQRELFSALEEGNLVYSLRSSLAILGLDYETPPDEIPSLDGDCVVFTLKLVKYTDQYMSNESSIGDLFVPGVPLGKFYIDDPKRHVRDDLQGYLASGHVTAEEGWHVGKDNELMLPLPNRILKPNSEYSEDVLREIVNKRLPSSSLTQFLSSEPVDDIYVRPGLGVVTNPLLKTGKLEVIVLDSKIGGVNHTRARFGSSGTQQGLFYIELFGDSGNVPVTEIGIRLCYPNSSNTNI